MGIVTEEDIVRVLKGVDLSKYPDPSKLSPLAQALWTLAIVKDNTEVKKITAKAISFILSELKEISLLEKTITNSFNRAGDKIRVYNDDKKIYYEIMASGRDFITNDIRGDNGVLFFTGKNAWSDLNKRFPKMIDALEGELLIVDPFYGHGTFEVLAKFGTKKTVRFLTSTLGSEEKNNVKQFDIDLNRFKKEFKNIQMKKYDKFYELHDRYILANNALIIVGQGIKDLANKESFLIFLPTTMVSEFLPILKGTFEERWLKSVSI